MIYLKKPDIHDLPHIARWLLERSLLKGERGVRIEKHILKQLKDHSSLENGLMAYRNDKRLFYFELLNGYELFLAAPERSLCRNNIAYLYWKYALQYTLSNSQHQEIRVELSEDREAEEWALQRLGFTLEQSYAGCLLYLLRLNPNE